MCSKIKYVFTVLVGALFSMIVSAETVTVNSQGTSSSFELARAEALKDAIMQVSGVHLDSDTVIHSILDQVSLNEKQDTFMNTSQAQSLREKIKGTVTGFRVLDQAKNPDGTVTVWLQVDMEKYKVPGPENKRRSISVQAFEANTVGKCFGKPITQSDQVKAITEAVQTSFVTSRKFAILDRHSDAYALEKQFINSEDVKITEQAKLGQNKGSDYIVSGTVRYVGADESRHKMQLSNSIRVSRQARAEFGFNLMAFATREIQLSSNVTVRLDENLNGLSCEEILNRLSQKAASEITRKATQSIYPPQIINYSGRMFYFNYGGDEVKLGEVYGLYSVGEAIYDPYTKEPLGNLEELVGLVKVVDVKPKYSIATWVDPQMNGPVKKGDILRPYVEPKQSSQPTVKKKLSKKLDDEW